eukprot:6492737-Amphidinium_carterae.2
MTSWQTEQLMDAAAAAARADTDEFTIPILCCELCGDSSAEIALRCPLHLHSGFDTRIRKKCAA